MCFPGNYCKDGSQYFIILYLSLLQTLQQSAPLFYSWEWSQQIVCCWQQIYTRQCAFQVGSHDYYTVKNKKVYIQSWRLILTCHKLPALRTNYFTLLRNVHFFVLQSFTLGDLTQATVCSLTPLSKRHIPDKLTSLTASWAASLVQNVTKA